MGFFDSFKTSVKVYLRHQVFFPGNIVEGFVEIKCSGEITMVAVRCKVTAKEHIVIRREELDHGQMSHGARRQRHNHVNRRYDSDLKLFQQLLTLVGPTRASGSRQSIKVPAGTYTYPFAFQLPYDIPPSFFQAAGAGRERDTASIQYYVECFVDIPNGRDAASKGYFTVLRPMPIQQHANAAPHSMDRNWDVKCCCCIDKGKVTARLFMDRTVIAIDRDNLTVCADIDNTNGKEPVESLEVSLKQHLVFSAQGRREQNHICPGKQFIKQRVEAGQKGRIAATIPLPRNVTPTLQTWNISSTHYIEIELNIPWATDPSHKIPVFIVQTVDPANIAPPINFQQCHLQVVPKGMAPEFVYRPPPRPVYQHTPIQAPPDPTHQQAPAWDMSQVSIQMPLPSQGAWGGGPIMEDGTPQNPNAVQWGGGFAQEERPFSQPPPPTDPWGGGGGGASNPGGDPAAPSTAAPSAPASGNNQLGQPLLDDGML